MHPDPVSLGSLEPGQAAEAGFVVRNPLAEAVTVARIETSCPCVRVEPATARVEPGGDARLTAAFDPADEPDFRGGLTVTVVGHGPGDEEWFRTRVRLDVRPAPPVPRPAGSDAAAPDDSAAQPRGSR